jgi:hypothetical protein
MAFHSMDLIGLLAPERQRELIESAGQRHLVRQARRTHPSYRWRRSPEPPNAG